MQTIIRTNSPYGTDPETGGEADRGSVETAFVRVPLHQKYWQAQLNTINCYKKLIKHFFVECDMCYGFFSGSPIYSGLQTVIFLNCKFSQYNYAVNHNGANPQIHIETIDDSCKQFTAAEKAAGRSVTELTVKVLCEQLKLIKIPETEKMELINEFVQRRGVQNEEVLGALCASGFDYMDFAQKKGISNDQVLIILAQNSVDMSDFVQKKGITNDQVLTVFVKNSVDASSFIKDKGITNNQVLVALTKNNVDCSDFALKNSISNDQVLIVLSKNGVDVFNFAQKQGISNEQVLLLLVKENLDYIGFALRRGMKDEQLLITLMKNNFDYNTFAASKSISNEQILVALAKSDQNYQTFAQSKGFTDEQVLITLMKSGVDIKPFIQSKNISNEQIIRLIQSSNLPLSDKYDLLQQITPVDLRSEQEDIHNALIKREYELTNERVLKFVNNKQRELILEIIFKEALLKQKKNEDDSAVNEIAELKLKNQELQKLNNEIKLECEQKIADIKTSYEAELIKCKNEVETLRKEYQQDLQKEYEKYKNEIDELKQTIEVEQQNINRIQESQQKRFISDQEIDMNDTITKQLKMECQILKQQLIDEKEFHYDQQEIVQQHLKRTQQRNLEIQRQLTQEKTQRLLFFEDLQQKQSEITKQLEFNVKEQASRIVHLENENQSLQSTLNALREQIEKLNVQEYQKRIEMQTKQLEDKDEYIEKLKEEMEKINVNQLQDKQIEKVLTILKSVEISQ
ncbi:Hypothetical_protein [Hexamita inflata]|uniref:Hypothetical_protein n=1 Tax=Hexamita inflata TaxID=28002 RepID=A0AA86PCK3_9EUKA|nr:Hypothetical protein HINF_LOCUS24154 [Hexamita inflata]